MSQLLKGLPWKSEDLCSDIQNSQEKPGTETDTNYPCGGEMGDWKQMDPRMKLVTLQMTAGLSSK